MNVTLSKIISLCIIIRYHCSTDCAEVKWVVSLKKEHAHTSHDVIEDDN